MLELVSQKNIKTLINNAKLWLPNASTKSELSEYETFLIEFFNGNNIQRKFYTFSEAESFLRQAKNASILVYPELAINSVEQVVNTLESINEKTIEKLSDIYRSFYLAYDKNTKIKGRNERDIPETTNLSDNIRTWVKKIFKKSDKIIEDLSISGLDKLTDISSLYRILKPFMPLSYYDKAKDMVVRHTDIVINKILSNKFLESFDPANAIEVLKKLTDESLSDSKLNPDELSKLIKQASSILNFSSAEKIDSCINIIGNYRDYLISLAENDLEFKNFINENITFKKLISRSGTILSSSQDLNNVNFMLLTGQTIDSINSKLGNTALTKCSVEDIKKFKNIKINLSPYDLYHILTNNTSILSLMTPSKILQIADSFEKSIDEASKVIKKSSRYKKSHFKLEELLNRKNLFQLTTINEQSSKFIPTLTENILTLNEIMKSSEIFKIMQNNMSVLLQDSEVLKNDITLLKQKYSGNLPLLSAAVNAYVNSKFTKIADFSEGRKPLTEKSSGTVDSINKIDLIINPNEEFHIEVDGGIEYKTPTFTEKIKSFSITDCIEVLNNTLDNIHEKLSLPIDKFAYNIAQSKLQIKQAKQLFDLLELQIKALDRTDKYSARSHKKYMNSLKKQFADISDFCKKEMLKISKHFNYDSISEHQKPSAPGSTTQTMQSLLDLSKTADDPEVQAQLKAVRDDLLKKNKEKIKAENISANKDRIEQKSKYALYNPLYEYCSIISSEIDTLLFDSDTKIKE